MGVLPKTLIVIDNDLAEHASFKRVEAKDLFRGELLCEADYDDLLVRHHAVLSDCLREAALIGEHSTLRYMGRQTEKIDVLFAETDLRTGALQRFVIVEDKLCKNPEARRDVLGQILDYSMSLKELSFDEVAELSEDGSSSWFNDNVDLIHDVLRERKFLLLVCSDYVRPSLIDYARHLQEEFPLERMELALVSLAIYSNGDQHLLVPHVAGTVRMPERSLVIKVEVTDSVGRILKANVGGEWTAPDEDTERGKISEAEMLKEIGRRTPAARPIAEYFLGEARTLGMVVDFKAAAASIRVKNAATHRPCTLFVLTRRGTFYVAFLRRWNENAAVGLEYSQRYLAQLTQIIGKNPKVASGDLGGRKALSLIEVGPRRQEIMAVVAETMTKLRDARAPELGGHEFEA